MMSNVEQIILLQKQEGELTEELEANRWEQARLISEELAGCKTQRELAENIGKSHVHVGTMARVWREFGNHGYQHCRTFDSYYQEVKRGKAERYEPERHSDTSYQPVSEPRVLSRNPNLHPESDAIDESEAALTQAVEAIKTLYRLCRTSPDLRAIAVNALETIRVNIDATLGEVK